MTRRREAGFTLLELIVAAGILALIAVFSWRGLDTLIREREAIAASQASIDVMQRCFARIERDALLAADAQLDDNGTMRLLAGTAAPDGGNAPTVEYRIAAGVLTRSVNGVDRAPLVVLDGLATLSIEAWAPAPGGGAWVRVKGAATEAPKSPTGPGNATTNASSSASSNASSNATGNPNAATTNAAVPPGTDANRNPLPNVTGTGRGQVGPVVAAATGIRLSFVRADGMPITRAFMVGGG